MNDKNYDFLRELTEVDDMKINEIARKYPVTDKAMLNRIKISCEGKMKMKEEKAKYDVTERNAEALNDEKIRNIPWYRRPAFTAAACFAVIIAATGGIALLFGRHSDEPDIHEMPPLTVVETTTLAETSETTTESSVSAVTDMQSATTAVRVTTVSAAEDVTEEVTTVAAEEVTQEVETTTAEIPDDTISSDISSRMSSGLAALDFAEQLMSNGIGVDCDMDDSFTDESGQLYVRVTESGFATVADVESYLRSYMTNNCINGRYSGLIDANSGKFIENENGLYIRYAPKAAAFLVVDYEYHKNDGFYTAVGAYDNFGETRNIEVVFVFEGDSLKIDNLNFYINP